MKGLGHKELTKNGGWVSSIQDGWVNFYKIKVKIVSSVSLRQQCSEHLGPGAVIA